MSEVISISEFKFTSLRKYMSPVYSFLHRQAGAAEEEKQKIVRTAVSQFFQRLRSYREISLENLVLASSQVTAEEAISFERGEIALSRDLQDAYCKACYGHVELDYFFYELRAFQKPSVRDACRSIAKDLFSSRGIIVPYVDYQNLNYDEGRVLDLRRD